MPLRIEIKPHQHVDKNGNNVVVVFVDGRAKYVPGEVPYSWTDVTEDVDGFEDLELIYTRSEENKRSKENGASVQLSITGNAATLVTDWLFSNPAQLINYFDARITDTECRVVYKNFNLKPDNVEQCTDDGCLYTFPLREADDKYSVLKRLSIMDNWQKWYSEDGSKLHPTFQVVRMSPDTGFGGVKAGLMLATYAVFAGPLLSLFDTDKELKKALGFGYYCPSPKIYDILLNVCQKVGLTPDTPFNPGQFAQNDCLFIPYAGLYHKNFGNGDLNSPSAKFIWGNRYIWQVDSFLDEICKLYNCTWDIYGGKLVIVPYQSVAISEPIAAFEADRVCTEFDLQKKPGFGRYQWANDPSDNASSQVQNAYNDIVDYDGETENPLLEGSIEKNFRFASTGFLHDGFGDDYTEDILDDARNTAYIIIGVLAIAALALIPFAGAGAAVLAALAAAAIIVNNKVQNLKGQYGVNSTFNGIIRVRGMGEVSMPRIIRWDGISPLLNARAVKTPVANIIPNPTYNPDLVPYQNQPWGSSVYKTLTTAYNYPLYFDALYYGNMYDTLHERTDNPLVINFTNKTDSFQVPLCCDTIEQLGVLDGEVPIVGRIATINGSKILVTALTISYADRLISVKGTKML